LTSGTSIRLDGSAVLVTGAGRGLGRAYARALAGRGASVVVHDAGVDKDGSGSDARVAEDVARELPRAVAVTTNLETRDGCEAAVRAAVDAFGRLDALVSNAGLVHFAPIENVDSETWERQRAVNLDAAFWLARAAFPYMKRQRYGRIVLTTSGRAMMVEGNEDGLATYTAAKLGVVGLMFALAAEGASHGIRVNAVSPVAATRMLRRHAEPGELEPEQVAPAVVFLASEACDLNGVLVRASGGRFSHAEIRFGAEVDLGPSPTAEGVAANWSRIARAGNDAPS
jgi:NAD(P)-dependent dehydrogenase (short-subunit alcohol dehydrogenase family)